MSWLDICLKCLVILINNLGLRTRCLGWFERTGGYGLKKLLSYLFKFISGKANLLESIKLSHYLPCPSQRTQASTGWTAKWLVGKGPAKCRTRNRIPYRGFRGGHVKKVAKDSRLGGHAEFERAAGKGDLWQVGSYEDKFIAGHMTSILWRLSQVTPPLQWFSNLEQPRGLIRTSEYI